MNLAEKININTSTDENNSFFDKNGVSFGNLYLELVTPYCARVLNLKTREIKCIPSLKKSRAGFRFRNTKHFSQYLTKRFDKAESCVNADEMDVEALDFLARKLYLNENERITSVKTESNGEIRVNVRVLNKNRIYVIKQNEGENILLYE